MCNLLALSIQGNGAATKQSLQRSCIDLEWFCLWLEKKLRNAEHERSEAIAVDALGNIFIAQGGNDQAGAKQ